MEIRTKAEFFRLWESNALGFRLRTWPGTPEGLADALASEVPIFGFRQLQIAAGAFEIAPRAEVAAVAALWMRVGRVFCICEAAPDQLATIQGEIMGRGTARRGLIGRVKNAKRMRDSLRDGDLTPQGPAACLYLVNTYMAHGSREDLDALQELYPDSVIEFTCYGSHEFTPGRNTIFWEVRNY